MRKQRLEISALIELGILFLPSIPAYIWLWPNVDDSRYVDLVNSLVYLYVLGGTLVIGLRRWSWHQLGVNRLGIGLSLVCGGVFVLEQPISRWALGLPVNLRPFDLWRILGEVIFYFGLVGVVEELLFRGLVYRLFENLRGPGLAIFGSSLGFALWHIGWAGPLIVGHFLIGVIFGLIRWRAGGILGLVFVHGLYDLVNVEIQSQLTSHLLENLSNLKIANPAAVVLGDTLLLGLVLYLWLVYPRLQRFKD